MFTRQNLLDFDFTTLSEEDKNEIANRMSQIAESPPTKQDFQQGTEETRL